MPRPLERPGFDSVYYLSVHPLKLYTDSEARERRKPLTRSGNLPVNPASLVTATDSIPHTRPTAELRVTGRLVKSGFRFGPRRRAAVTRHRPNRKSRDPVRPAGPSGLSCDRRTGTAARCSSVSGLTA
jgi:hypothetical protein